jgi:hypothetical protein
MAYSNGMESLKNIQTSLCTTILRMADDDVSGDNERNFPIM